ncbi:MAG: hypothetical protein JW966_04770 [Anaerolineae bacterium]|nr:hypothetical protein [Anaerolineae bacterium]
MAAYQDVMCTKAAVNPDRLCDELIAVLGDCFVDLVIGGAEPGELHVILAADTPAELIELVSAVVSAHDAYAVDPAPPEPDTPQPQPVGDVLDIVFSLDAINIARLDADLRAALGQDFIGLSGGPGQQVRVHVRAGADAAVIADIAPLVAAHDPEQLTAAQQVAEEQAALVAALRAKPRDSWTDSDRDNALLWLFERLSSE